jgi:hypothetical protein
MINRNTQNIRGPWQKSRTFLGRTVAYCPLRLLLEPVSFQKSWLALPAVRARSISACRLLMRISLFEQINADFSNFLKPAPRTKYMFRFQSALWILGNETLLTMLFPIPEGILTTKRKTNPNQHQWKPTNCCLWRNASGDWEELIWSLVASWPPVNELLP